MTPRETVLSAVLAAPEERLETALRVLKGENPPMERRTSGPLLIGMGKAAEYLGVSRPTLWRMCKRGVFPKIMILPGSFRLRREDLEAFVYSRSGEASIHHESKGGEAQLDKTLV